MATVNENLLDNAVSHAIDLQHYSNGEVRKMLVILNKADIQLSEQLVIALQRLPRESFTVQRLDALLVEVNKLNGGTYQSIKKEFGNDLLELTRTEASYQYDLFQSVIPVDVSISKIAPEAVYAAAVARPFQISKDKAIDLSSYLEGLSTARAASIKEAIKLGFITGETTDQIVRRIMGTKSKNYADGLMEGSRQHIEGMVRTSVSHISNFTSQRFYEANSGMIKGVMWVSTLDGRTSATCMARDGRVYPIGSGPRPPAHINACLKGTKITTAKGLVNIEDVKVGDLVLTHLNRLKKVTTVMARRHDGNAVTLVDNFGRSVRLTNEHPIITRNKGWIEAGQIKRGDIFFNNIKEFEGLYGIGESSFIPQSVLINAHNIKTKLTEELVSYGIFSSTRGVSSSVKLNDSIVNDEIRVVSKNSVLSGVNNTNRIKNGCKKFFVIGWVVFHSNRERFSNFARGLFGERGVVDPHSSGASSGYFSSLFGVLFSPMVRTFFKVNVFRGVFEGFGSTFGLNAKMGAALSDSVITKAILSFNHPETFSVTPVLDSDEPDNFFVGSDNHNWFASTCTKVVEYHYSDYVYNLSVEDDETYVADGFLVHNCRSRTTPIVKSWRELGVDMDEFKSTRASLDGQIPEDMTYQKWLEKQSVARQDDILGPTKGKLFRAGQTVERFVDNKGKALTIAQLRERNAKLFDKLGL